MTPVTLPLFPDEHDAHSYRGVAGASRRLDPGTSKEAARSIDAASLEGRVFQYLLDHGPSILDEICKGMKIDKVTASPRLRPLERAGMVMRGKSRPGSSGRPQTEWCAIREK